MPKVYGSSMHPLWVCQVIQPSHIWDYFYVDVHYGKKIFLYSHIGINNCESSTVRKFVYSFIFDHNFEDTMETDSGANVTAEKTEPASPLRKHINEDTCVDNSHTSRDGTCGTTDVARARWTLLRQVLLASKGSTNLNFFRLLSANIYIFFISLDLYLCKSLFFRHYCRVIRVMGTYSSSRGRSFSLSCLLPKFGYKTILYLTLKYNCTV